MRRFVLTFLLAILVPGAALLAADEPVPVAVFNFQLKSPTPQWVWLEKYLADQVTTDFAAHRQLAVVARDRMQVLAQEMNWTPELSTDTASMDRVRRQLAIAYLVSGTCQVQGERLEITGQIVEVAGRREVFRKSVQGSAGQVLDLQKQLSAELLGWLLKRPAAELLPALPVWTRSVPAARSLYEGMDLYDHGQYRAAWLKFAVAARQDPGYLEAQYWVGKMFYFMDRYRHARAALERFVYMDASHPRMGDAIREYLDTYERLDAPPQVLLEHYQRFRDRWPQVLIPDSSGEAAGTPADRWLLFRQVRMLAEMGRYLEAVQLAHPALLDRRPGAEKLQNLIIENAVAYQALTGRTPATDLLIDPGRSFNPLGEFLRFAPDQHELIYRPPGAPLQLAGREYQARDAPAAPVEQEVEFRVVLIAPDGCVFRRLRLVPDSSGDDGIFQVAIAPARSNAPDYLPAASTGIAAARRDGLVVDALPTAGMFRLRICCRVKDRHTSGLTRLQSLRIETQLEKVPRHGAVRVRCQDAAEYWVDVDDRPGRFSDGLIGMLSPGEHRLTFRPAVPDAPQLPWDTTVQVEADKIVEVVGRLPWTEQTPWSTWQTCPLTPADYPGHDLEASSSFADAAPALLPEADRLRLVWSARRDLWTAVSAEGRTFSGPRRLDLPLSSAWDETRPRCIRDESGRYVLVFASDRDGRHVSYPYLCWSRDFVHWSAPALIAEVSLNAASFDFIQDSWGRYILVTCSPGFRYDQLYRFDLNLWISTDRVHWQPSRNALSYYILRGYRTEIRLAQRPDGSYAIVVATATSDRTSHSSSERVMLATSKDLLTWHFEPDIVELPGTISSISALWHEGRPRILLQRRADPSRDGQVAGPCLLIQDSDGNWRISQSLPGLAQDAVTDLTWWPARGYFLTRLDRPGAWWASGAQQCLGPYVLHSATLEGLTAAARPVAMPAPRYTIQEVKDENPPGRSVGGTRFELDSVHHVLQRKVLRADRGGDFMPPGPASGTLWSKACVVAFGTGSRRFTVALDATAAESTVPNLLRWNPAGTAEFTKTPVIPLASVSNGGDDGEERVIAYRAGRLQVPWKDRIVPVRVQAQYVQSGVEQKLELSLDFAAQAYCRFAGRIRRVVLLDGNSNLELTDQVKPNVVNGLPDGLPADAGDTIAVGTEADWEPTLGFYGQPILLDGALWTIRLSDGGRQISVEPYAGPTGRVRLKPLDGGCWLLGCQHVLFVRGSSDPVPVPADTYLVLQYRKALPGAKKARADLEALPVTGLASSHKPLVVAPGAMVDVPAPEH
ncbi:MAG: hypothetical protein BIFFINMI_02799 [Phycisphaerae bacterium]|nr:hypothetical protein [Phycisphaerae bacterium]